MILRYAVDCLLAVGGHLPVASHVAATHGILVGDGIESFDDWMDYSTVQSPPSL